MIRLTDAVPLLEHSAGPSMLPRMDERRYAGLPRFIFGLNGRGGEAHMLAARKPGWVVLQVSVNAPSSSGDCSALAAEGLGVIVQLEYGARAGAVLPCSGEYERFARKCAEFVAQSRGARLWVIGDEPNTRTSRPAQDDSEPEVITPELYARCFNRCREAIRSLPGHEHDWVIPAAAAPFDFETTYPSNPTGDWVRYFADVLLQITVQGGRADALAIHALTHGFDADLVSSEERVDEPFSNRRKHFRAYRDFLAAVTPAMRSLPVLITSAAPAHPCWSDEDRGWIQAACAEIDAWNSNPASQPVQALCFYRWDAPDDRPGSGIADKPLVVADFCAALQHPYRIRWPLANSPTDNGAETASLVAGEVEVPDFSGQRLYAGDRLHVRVRVMNAGGSGWPAEGSRSLSLGYRWRCTEGEEVRLRRYPGPFPMAGPALPGEYAAFEAVDLRTPHLPGVYRLEWQLLWQGAEQRLGPAVGAPVRIQARPQEWEATFTACDIPPFMTAGKTVYAQMEVLNSGKKVWPSKGEHRASIKGKWMDPTGAPADAPSVCVDLERGLAFDTRFAFSTGVTAPAVPGIYDLVWDVHRQGMGALPQVGGMPLTCRVRVTGEAGPGQGWRAEASHNCTAARLAVDGDLETRWSSLEPQSPGMWFRLNLGAPCLIDGLALRSHASGRPRGYVVQVSDDGLAWRQVERVEDGGGRDVVSAFSPLSVQYARVTLLAAAAREWSISEVEIHPGAVWSAAASVKGDIAPRAIDNDEQTSWTSAPALQKPGMWFQIDLGRSEWVSGLALVSAPEGTPEAFRITAWNERAGGWQSMGEGQGSDPDLRISFAPLETQYIQIQLTGKAERPWIIKEVRVDRAQTGWISAGSEIKEAGAQTASSAL